MHIFLWNAGKKASKKSGWDYWGFFPESLLVKKRKVIMGMVLSIGFGDVVWEALESWEAGHPPKCSCSL